MTINKILMFGKMPPPIGGVTISVKNLVESLKAKNIKAYFFGWKAILRHYDVAHIHYSSLSKRAIGIIIAKVVARKVMFTVHGKYFDQKSIYNKISAYLADEIIFLNENLVAENAEASFFDKINLLPSLYAEGFVSEADNIALFTPEPDKKTLLIYAYDRSYKNGEEVYGVEFIFNNMSDIPECYKIVLLDISGKYAPLAEMHKDRVIYINKEVNFLSLLQQVDYYIRPTCMDGASVAVQEALMLNVPVLASNIVDRPKNVAIFRYKDIDDFIEKLGMLKKTTETFKLQSIQMYLDVCEKPIC